MTRSQTVFSPSFLSPSPSSPTPFFFFFLSLHQLPSDYWDLRRSIRNMCGGLEAAWWEALRQAARPRLSQRAGASGGEKLSVSSKTETYWLFAGHYFPLNGQKEREKENFLPLNSSLKENRITELLLGIQSLMTLPSMSDSPWICLAVNYSQGLHMEWFHKKKNQTWLWKITIKQTSKYWNTRRNMAKAEYLTRFINWTCLIRSV